MVGVDIKPLNNPLIYILGGRWIHEYKSLTKEHFEQSHHNSSHQTKLSMSPLATECVYSIFKRKPLPHASIIGIFLQYYYLFTIIMMIQIP